MNLLCVAPVLTPWAVTSAPAGAVPRVHVLRFPGLALTKAFESLAPRHKQAFVADLVVSVEQEFRLGHK